jgi:hypothetical protein
LIGQAVHPLSILFHLSSLVLEMLKRPINSLSALPKPIRTGNNFYRVHESRSFPDQR